MTPRFRNIYLPTVSQNRSRPLLNNSGHCLEKGTGSRSGVEDTTIPDTLVTPISIPSFRQVSITEPGLFQPTLATVRRTAQDLIWRMKSQSHLKLHHPNRLESH